MFAVSEIELCPRVSLENLRADIYQGTPFAVLSNVIGSARGKVEVYDAQNVRMIQSQATTARSSSDPYNLLRSKYFLNLSATTRGG